jgi:hypothetical protein
MISSIQQIQQIVSVIRREAAGRAAPAAAPEAVCAGLSKTQGARKGQAQERGRLAEIVERRIRAIVRDDPERGRKTFRVFLEAVLLIEFGEDLMGDPAFFRMIDEIQAFMEADAQLGPAVRHAVDTLTSNVDRNVRHR